MEPLAQQEIGFRNKLYHKSLEDRIKELFAVTEESKSEENKLDAITDALSRQFLSASNTNTEIGLAELAEKFKETEIPLDSTQAGDYVNLLARDIVAHAIQTSSPRFIGHMTSALPYFLRPVAKLITAMNQNMVKVETAKSLTFYERQALAMIHRLIYAFSDEFYRTHVQRPKSTLGVMVSGGTVANLTALWCARNRALGPASDFGGVEQEGLPQALKYYGHDRAVIIGSSLMHYSFEKAATLLGMGINSLIRIPPDARNRIDLARLREVVSECKAQNRLIVAIVGVAGSTDCASIDPLTDMAEIAREAKTHFHVDGAWGAAFLLSNRHKKKLDGIEFADSVTLDGHKQLYLPQGVGMLMLRDPEMAQIIEKQARYILRPGSLDLGKRSLEGSRPAVSIYLHCALKVMGQKGYEFLLDEALRKAGYMAAEISRRSHFELLEKPDLNILVYRYVPVSLSEKAARGELTESDNIFLNELNKKIQRAQRKAGNSFVSRTNLDLSARGIAGQITALRAVIANPLTTESDIDAVLDEQAQIALSMSQDATYASNHQQANPR